MITLTNEQAKVLRQFMSRSRNFLGGVECAEAHRRAVRDDIIEDSRTWERIILEKQNER